MEVKYIGKRINRFNRTNKNFEGTEEEEDILLEKLQNLVLDPEISDYIYWTDMSSEEIADKVLAYKPIILKNK